MLGVACATPGEPLPAGSRAYLDALVAGDTRVAYDRSQLFDLASGFGPGGAVSFKHFDAYWKRSPLRGYSVTDVTRIESRSIEAVDRPGVSFYEIDVTLRFAESERAETMTELGDVLPRVQIEPDRLFLALPSGTKAIDVDGVRTTVSSATVPDHGEVFPVLLLKGKHEIRVGTVTAVISTSPLAVVSGDGEVVRDVDQAGIVRIG